MKLITSVHNRVLQVEKDLEKNDALVNTTALFGLPCSSEPSAKPQSSRPSHTRLAGRHLPLAH